ncbi:hypothetical protein [Castellaniella sp. UC4442_H9]
MKGIPNPRTQRAQVDQNEQPHIATGACCIAGCKLPGTIAASTTGSSEWFCRLHFGAAYAENADITLRANNRIGLYRLALAWSNEPPNTRIPADVADTLRRFHRESVLTAKPPVDGRPLTLRTMARHLLSQLDAECRDASTPTFEPDQPRRAGDTWTHAADIAADAFV